MPTPWFPCCTGTARLCEDDLCDDDDIPSDWSVVLSGYSAPYTDINATYTVSNNNGTCWGSDRCYAVLFVNNGTHVFYIQLHVKDCTTNKLHVFLDVGSCLSPECGTVGFYGSFIKDYGASKIPCTSLSSQSIPQTHTGVSGFGSGACAVTSL